VRYSVTLALCASTVILAIESRGILKAVLCHPMLVYIGTISYTIYLIHMSALYVVRSLHLNRLIATAAALAITLAFASASWFLLEKRLTRGRIAVQLPDVAVPASAGLAS
jgi:peptidoglycan/LPS O-acetylase OafA/YrhL